MRDRGGGPLCILSLLFRFLTRRSPEYDPPVASAPLRVLLADDVLKTVAKERPRLGVVITSAGQLPDSLRSLRLAHGGILLRKPFARSALLCVVEDSLTREDA